MRYPKRHFFLGKAVKAFPFFCFLLFSLQAKTQNTEIGGGIGGLSYTGDLNRGYSLLQNRPAITVFHRTNLSNVVSFKAGITAGKIAGSDEKGEVDAFSNQRNASFNVFIFETSGVLEYHFLNWRSEHSLLRWTPYVFGGVGIFVMSGHQNKPEEYSNVQPILPFGLGFKYILNPKWYLGFEAGARKTFFDYLDNVSEGNIAVKNYQYGNTNDNDMYYYVGFTINYSFYTIPCPFSYN